MKNTECLRERLLLFLQEVDKGGCYIDEKAHMELGEVIPMNDALKLLYHEVLWRLDVVYEQFKGDSSRFFELDLVEMKQLSQACGIEKNIMNFLKQLEVEEGLNQVSYRRLENLLFG